MQKILILAFLFSGYSNCNLAVGENLRGVATGKALLQLTDISGGTKAISVDRSATVGQVKELLSKLYTSEKAAVSASDFKILQVLQKSAQRNLLTTNTTPATRELADQENALAATTGSTVLQAPGTLSPLLVVGQQPNTTFSLKTGITKTP